MSTEKQLVDLIPLHSNLLIEPTEATDKIGSLYIPEAHKAKLNQGKVIEKGKNCSDAILVGDIVFFQFHSESNLEYSGKKYIMVDESACIGAIRKVQPKK